MDKYNDRQCDRAGRHAQMMQKQRQRQQRASYGCLAQTSREIEFEQRLQATQAMVSRKREREQRVKSEMQDSNHALMNIAMQTGGAIALASFFYIIFITFSGI